MSDRPDWTECLYRPSMLCGEREEYKRGAGTVDMREVWRMMETPHLQQPQDGLPAPEASHDASTTPLPPAPAADAAVATALPIRHKGLLLASYWAVVNELYAGVGDVVVVKSPSDYVVIRRVSRSRQWVDDAQLRIAGAAERRLCIYGFVLQRDIERIAAELRSGRYALVAACEPRAVVKPPRREELYNIWRYEGYVINASPAKMALIRLAPGKPKFAVDYLKKGCPIYSQHLNQILQLSGIPIQLVC